MIISGFVAFVSCVTDVGKSPKNRVANETAASEADLVSACDQYAQSRIKNPSSYSSAWGWDTRTSGLDMIVRRNFTAMNGFGANLDFYYQCKADLSTGNVLELNIYEGNWR